MNFGRKFKSLVVIGSFCLAQAATASTPDIKSIARHYADIAHSVYGDSVTTAQTLQKAVNKLWFSLI